MGLYKSYDKQVLIAIPDVRVPHPEHWDLVYVYKLSGSGAQTDWRSSLNEIAVVSFNRLMSFCIVREL